MMVQRCQSCGALVDPQEQGFCPSCRVAYCVKSVTWDSLLPHVEARLDEELRLARLQGSETTPGSKDQ